MNKNIPSPTNWPDSRAGKKLAAKRARLIPIACGNELDAQGKLLHLVRGFQRSDPGHLVGFVGAFMYRDKDGDVHVRNSAHGRVGYDQQIMMMRKLQRWLESDD